MAGKPARVRVFRDGVHAEPAGSEDGSERLVGEPGILPSGFNGRD